MSQPVAVPWKTEMRRVTRYGMGGTRIVEWLPPEGVVTQARDHFLEAMRWSEEMPLMASTLQTASAPRYLCGAMLRRVRGILARRTADAGVHSAMTEVLRAEHDAEPHYFTPHGERCLIIDRQINRRLAVYDLRRDRRVVTQDMGQGILVYRLMFDTQDSRWKLDSLTQELPAGWGASSLMNILQDNTHFLAHLERMIGRGLSFPIGRDQ